MDPERTAPERGEVTLDQYAPDLCGARGTTCGADPRVENSERMVNVRHIAIVLASFLSFPGCRGQCQTDEARPPFRLVYAPRDKTIESPRRDDASRSRHEGITDFWLRGPGVNVCLMVRMKDNFKVGIGGEAALFSFRLGAFQPALPRA